MDEKFLYILLGLAYLAFQYFGNLKKQQKEAEKKHPPPPRRDGPPSFDTPERERETVEQQRHEPVTSLEEIIRQAADEARRQREEKRRQREIERQQQRPAPAPQSQRTWVSETKKSQQRKPQQRRQTAYEEYLSTHQMPEEGIPAFPNQNQVATVPTVTQNDERQQPVPIDLRQAILHQVILERPRWW